MKSHRVQEALHRMSLVCGIALVTALTSGGVALTGTLLTQESEILAAQDKAIAGGKAQDTAFVELITEFMEERDIHEYNLAELQHIVNMISVLIDTSTEYTQEEKQIMMQQVESILLTEEGLQKAIANEIPDSDTLWKKQWRNQWEQNNQELHNEEVHARISAYLSSTGTPSETLDPSLQRAAIDVLIQVSDTLSFVDTTTELHTQIRALRTGLQVYANELYEADVSKERIVEILRMVSQELSSIYTALLEASESPAVVTYDQTQSFVDAVSVLQTEGDRFLQHVALEGILLQPTATVAYLSALEAIENVESSCGDTQLGSTEISVPCAVAVRSVSGHLRTVREVVYAQAVEDADLAAVLEEFSNE